MVWLNIAMDANKGEHKVMQMHKYMHKMVTSCTATQRDTATSHLTTSHTNAACHLTSHRGRSISRSGNREAVQLE